MSDSYGPVTGHKFLAWIETADGLLAVDTGYDIADGAEYAGSDLEALTQASEQSGKPLTHILQSHDHPDHCMNLPLLRERWPAVQLCAHTNSSLSGVNVILQGGELLTLGGVRVQVLYTPGHSQHNDELCYYLPDYRFLFCGDVAQPQGPSYALANDWSPVPYFYDGDKYRTSLEKLVALDVNHMRTGHGNFMGPEQARQWLRVTLATVLRIEALAEEYVGKYPTKAAEWIAETVYDQIVAERHFPARTARSRKTTSINPPLTDYERYDLPGILWAVTEAQSVL